MASLAEIQKHVGVVPDGVWGKNTAAAIAKALGMGAIVAPVFSLKDKEAFYQSIRKVTGPLDQVQVDTIEAMLKAAEHWPLGWIAYAFATAWHEARLRPINELGGNAYLFKMYDIKGSRPAKATELGNLTTGDGVKYAGRGLVQLTGKTNYANAGKELNVDLVGSPDLALVPGNATRILVWGMETGAFTGKALKHYLGGWRGTVPDFTKARRIINGTDKAALIAGYAVKFQDAFEEGGWT